jgi:hypothetical protein
MNEAFKKELGEELTRYYVKLGYKEEEAVKIVFKLIENL